MPRVRDPQGHEFEATDAQLKAGVPCKKCGWTCTTADIIATAQEPPPEPSHEPPPATPDDDEDTSEDDGDDEA